MSQTKDMKLNFRSQKKNQHSVVALKDLHSKYQMLNQMMNVNKVRIKQLKDELGCSKLNKEMTELKANIYELMTEQGIDEYEEIKIDKVKPTKIRKEERIESKKTTIENILEEQITDGELRSELVSEIVQIK